ncbi:hypothetical protein POM88_012686 [Heracleum sosnowskyi]|uniref:Uncharacterized protein n=1 Tax=Heracleum sosnowskyi TaxID=360622 RepID=A0AAD8MXH9_9APIA|nr:hypothetical protein POM88_012686 [Heracleum sosnowskyi]
MGTYASTYIAFLVLLTSNMHKILRDHPISGSIRALFQRKEEDMLAQKKIPDGEKEEISQLRNQINSEEPDDDTSLASAYQGLPIPENNSPSNDNLTESEKLSHARKGSSSGSISVPETVLSPSKVDRPKEVQEIAKRNSKSRNKITETHTTGSTSLAQVAHML